MTRKIVARRLLPPVLLALAIGACSGPAVVESSASAVTIRYSGLDGLEEATRLAQKACAAHQKKARLRNNNSFGLTERYGHFDCV